MRTPLRPACAPPSLDPGSVFGAPREIWNIGEASPALVQNHGTLQRTAGQFPVPPSHAKLRVPIFLFTTARHVHCPSSSLHSSLTLFACLPSPNARYSTHHIGLSIAPQTCRPSFRTLQSFSAFFIISSANSLVESESQQLKITFNIPPAGFFTLEYRPDTRRERQKSGDIQISTCIPHGVVPPLCRRTESDQLVYARLISGYLKKEAGNKNITTRNGIQRKKSCSVAWDKILRLSILGFGNFKHYHGIIFGSRHFPPRCTYRSHNCLSQYQLCLQQARS